MTLTRAGRIILLPLLLGITLFAVFYLNLGQYLRLETLSENREWLNARVSGAPLISALAFVGIYAVVVALSIPGATIVTVTGGFLFGTVFGAAYSVIGATSGAVLLFLIARSSLGEIVRFRDRGELARLRRGFERDALSYMLFLRLVPAFPFWLVNLAAAFLGVSARNFIVGTAIGIIPGSLVYASVGSGLGRILDRNEAPNLSIIFEPVVLLPLLGLGALSLVPILLRRRASRLSDDSGKTETSEKG